MDKEIWKPVVGYEGIYEISSLGRVRGMDRYYTNSMGTKVFVPGQPIAVNIMKRTGYPHVSLNKEGRRKGHFIHRLIAEAFLPNPDNLPCVNHKDENRANSVLSNIEWCSYRYNLMYKDSNKRRGIVKHQHFVENGRIRSVRQYDTDGTFIKEYPEGMYQIKREYGISVKDSLFSNGKTTSHGYVWLYSDIPFDATVMGKGNANQVIKCVIVYSDKGEEIKQYTSINDAARDTGIYREKFRRSKVVDGYHVINGMRFKIVENKSLEKYYNINK